MHSDTKAAGATWLDKGAFIIIGRACYPNNYLLDEYTSCNLHFELDGELDDVAFFANALTAAQISERWDQSLTNRRAAGQEPDLILFYNFNDPLTTAGTVANLGTAGSDYDLVLGALPKAAGSSVFGTKFQSGGSTYSITAPSIVPGTNPTAWTTPKQYDSTAPIVVSAAAGGT
eukprot:2899028-Prymnesium_polylepis.1